MKLESIELTGRSVRLEPLDLRHGSDLAEAGNDARIWQYMSYGQIENYEGMKEMVQMLLDRQRAGTDIPFAVISLKDQKAIGMTRYMDIQIHNRGLEIGGTWYGLNYQRTGVNTECKFLLLGHAFETAGAIRVQIKTDLRNERSQRAIERIGAVNEGILRDHMLLPDGTVRSSVYYSVLKREWPAVKEKLINLMARYPKE